MIVRRCWQRAEITFWRQSWQHFCKIRGETLARDARKLGLRASRVDGEFTWGKAAFGVGHRCRHGHRLGLTLVAGWFWGGDD